MSPIKNRNHGFDVVVYHADYDDGIRIVGEISPYHPAVMHLANGDPGYPAEGGDIEDYKIFDVVTGKEIEDPDGKILESVIDEVYEKASEDAAAERAEARAEARRDD